VLGKVKKTHGELYINDLAANLSMFKKLIGYVPQEDIMLKELTGN
jgi:ABC-type multidrug transport system ATPase subunit